jgi:4-amino-4-deoxy-L-arabinose transferase-like glycosyltransferase
VELRGLGHAGLARAVRSREARAWIAALVALTLVRLAVAAALPLSPDEAYYWVWSRALAPGYLDHPPMVALWIRAGTWLAGEGAFGIRLLGPLAIALGSVLLADAGERLFPGRRAGLVAATLLNATLLLGGGAVTMTPDTPLLFFWVAALWALVRLVRDRRGAWLLAVGLFAGLALDSKYTAVFLGLGVLLWLLIVPSARASLRTPYPWLAGLVAALLFAPVMAWNASHDWVSFARQGGRTGAWDPARALQFLGELIGGQIGLATPLIFVILAGGVVTTVHRAWRGRDPAWTLLAALTVPPLLVFLQHAFGDRVQGNWPAILYPPAALAGSGLTGRFWQRLRLPAVALGGAITVAVYAQATIGLVPLSPRIDPTALRLAGWPALAGQLAAIAREQGARFVAADDYGVAAKLARTLPPGLAVIGAEQRWRLFDLPPADLAGSSGLLVRSMRRDASVDRAPWAELREIGQASRARDGQEIERFRVYRVIGRPALPSTVLLPRPNTRASD